MFEFFRALDLGISQFISLLLFVTQPESYLHCGFAESFLLNRDTPFLLFVVVVLKPTHGLVPTEHVPLVGVLVNSRHPSVRKAEAGWGCRGVCVYHEFELHDKTLSQKIGDEIFSKRVLIL